MIPTGMWRCRYLLINTGIPSTCLSVTAAFSDVTRKSSRKPLL